MLRKLKAVAFYTLCWLAYYQLVDIFRAPSFENQIKLLWAVLAGALFAYVMGFGFSIKPKAKVNSTVD